MNSVVMEPPAQHPKREPVLRPEDIEAYATRGPSGFLIWYRVQHDGADPDPEYMLSLSYELHRRERRTAAGAVAGALRFLGEIFR